MIRAVTLAVGLGLTPMAQAHEEALEIARAIGDPSLIARALLNASFVPLVTGAIDRAEQLQRETLAAAVVAGAPDVIAKAALSIGNRELFQGNADAAVAAIDEAIALRGEAGDRISVAEGLLLLAAARHLLRELEASAALIREPGGSTSRRAMSWESWRLLFPRPRRRISAGGTTAARS